MSSVQLDSASPHTAGEYTGRDTLSVSALKMLWGCPEKFRLHYHEGLPTDGSIAMEQGSVVHAGLAFAMVGKQYTTAQAMRGIGYYMKKKAQDHKKLGWSEDERAQFLLYLETQLLPAYYAHPLAAKDLTDTELFLRAEQFSPPLVTYIDAVREDHRLVDYKTTSRRPPDSGRALDLQLWAYALVYWKSKGIPPPTVSYLYIVLTKEPQFFEETYEVTVGDLRRVEQDIQENIDLLAMLQASCKNTWPKFRSNCFDFNRPCEFLDRCFPRPKF